ncbi:MAG TPA: Ig-like domain-containing protein, partial [Verrucomicrobiae bacterium]|nr:Ig-like domain-containing protein [Verrucomicrobiae bacterium]
IRLDTAGPALTVASPAGGDVLTRPLTVVALASDPSGVSHVDFYVDGALLFSDTTNTFSFDWDVRGFANGPHVLGVIAVDGVGRETRKDIGVSIATAPPTAPVIGAPANGATTSSATIAVTGTSNPAVTISLYRNGALSSRTTSDGAGVWSFPGVGLDEGPNSFTAFASDPIGSSGPSAAILVTLDTGAPPPPSFLQFQNLGAGAIRFDWLPSPAADVVSYNLYRSAATFASRNQATRLTTAISVLHTGDSPAGGASSFYAVTAVDASGNEGEISNVVEIAVDTTPPTAAATALPTGVVGPGAVTLTLVVSEAITGDPFLSVTPAGGSPTSLVMTPTGAPGTWSGIFNVTTSTPTGTAAVAFSAFDPAGNRGTKLTSGATLVIDSRGPVGAVAVTPMKTLGAGTYPVALTLDEPAAATPILRFLPPVGPPAGIALTGAGASWQGNLVIDSGMGDGPGRFDLSAIDGLGNATSGLVAGAGVDVDNTPPVAPLGFTVTVLAGGSIRLAWSPVSDAVLYVVDRDDGTLVFGAGPHASLAPGAATTATDLPAADGDFAYAVRGIDAAGNVGPYSNAAGATSDRTPPGDPSGLLLALEGKGIRLNWTAPAVNPAASFSIFRSNAPITTLTGLLPVQAGLVAPTALDLPPADGSYHYAVAALDGSKNRSGFASAGPLLFDEAAPVITVGGVTDGQVAGTPRTITFSATDFSLQSISATLDGSPFTSGSTVSAEGNYALVVTANDSASNVSTKTIAFTIDTTPPAVAVTGVTDGATLATAATPVIAITEPHPGASTIKLNGVVFASGTPVTADGTYALVVHATDLAGNVTDVTTHFVIDAAPPAIATLSLDLPDGGFPILTWPARPEPDVAGYLVSRDGVSLSAQPLNVTTFEDRGFDPFSTQVYSVVAVDLAGHASPPREATLEPAGLALGSYGTGQLLTRLYFDTIGAVVENRGTSPLGALSLEMTLRDGATVLGARTLPNPAGLAAGTSATFT